MTGSATQASAARLVGRGRAFHLDRRALSAGALGATLVLSVGLTDGGYYGRETTVLTLAFAAVALLGAMHGGRLSRAGSTALGALSALLAWTALSGSWAVPGALVEQEARRALLYATALAALLLAVDHGRRRALLLGVAAGISALGLVAVGMRAASGEIVDRFYGTLLEEPVGYPNALGVLAAVGVVIGVGLELSNRAGRAMRGSAALLVLVLGLTGSRGATLALVTGLFALVVLGPSAARRATTLRALVPALLGGAAWAVAVATNAGDGRLVCVAVGACVSGALCPDPTRVPRRQALVAVACLTVVALAALALFRPVATTSSFRTAYWRAALAEAREHPLLGSGAGSFHLTWTDRGTGGMFVKDAHSLYVETLSELGPVGFVLVVALVAIPIVAAIRVRGDPVAAAAGGAFVTFAVHAGLDWDWEMPAVTLVALGCAAALLAGGPITSSTSRQMNGQGGKT